VIKHTTPCGVAVAPSIVEAFEKARSTDPVSAYGSVVAFNTVVDEATARAMSDLFVEVVVAPSFHAEALDVWLEPSGLSFEDLKHKRTLLPTREYDNTRFRTPSLAFLAASLALDAIRHLSSIIFAT
jgi:phosphoribosylaminoimidazolecarboxamide formyltransferase/IMP cyclohydrolase